MTVAPLELTSLFLSLAAILLVAFTIWFSRRLCKKTEDSAASMRDNMIRVDGIVRSMKDDISGIVNDAVEHWTRLSGVAPASQTDPTAQLGDSIANLEEKIASLKDGVDPALKTSVSKSLEEIRVLQREIARDRQSTLEALKEIQRRSIFPNFPRNHAPVLKHTATDKGEHIVLDHQGRIRNSGFLSLHVPYEVLRVEAVFSFAARFRAAPRPTVKVVTTPPQTTPRAIEHTVGATPKTLRVTLLRQDRDLLPAGTYLIEYHLHSPELHSGESTT